MARKQIVNGKVYDWSSVTIGMSGCGGIEPKEISYDDEKEKTLIYGKGGRIRGYGTGQAKNAVKISMLIEDFNIFMDAVKASYKKNKFYDVVVPKITVSYADTGCTTCTETLTKVTFSKRSLKVAEGDNSLTVELEGVAVGEIAINGITG